MLPERQRGFTLVQTAVLMVVMGIGLLLVARLALPPQQRPKLDQTKAELVAVGEVLISFAAARGRLPCPDVNGDGLEGTGGICAPGDVVGKVPYRDLGLPDPVEDQRDLPVRYAVYRNPAATADLVLESNRFIPFLPGDPSTLTELVGNYTGLPGQAQSTLR